jgi:hypothetical protein
MDSKNRDDAKGGRRANERRARESLRDTMIQGGMELLDLHGLTLTYRSISYAKVFGYLEREYSIRVTRGSVHERIWASQDEFRRDVLIESVRFFPPSNLILALGKAAAGAGSIDQFARDFSAETYPELLNSATFGQFQEAKALSSRLDDPKATAVLHELFNQRAETSLTASRSRFPSFLAALGLQTKASFGLSTDDVGEIFNVMMGGLAEGARLNGMAGSFDLSVPIDYLSEPADSADPWCALSIGIRSIVEFLFEPTDNPSDPDVEVPMEPVVGKAVSDALLLPTPRRSRERLRKLVLTAGVELFLQDGLELMPELLNYTSVLTHLETTRGEVITRSAVHRRIWDSNDDYRVDVLSALLTTEARETRLFAEMLRDVAQERRIDDTTDICRSKNILIRELAASVSASSLDNPSRRRLIQVKALVESQTPATASRLRAAIKQSDLDRFRRNQVEIQGSIISLGFRVRSVTGLSEEQGLEVLMALCMSTAAGLSLNRLAGVTAVARPMAMRLDGDEPVDWTPPGVAMLAFFDQLYEPVDVAYAASR